MLLADLCVACIGRMPCTVVVAQVQSSQGVDPCMATRRKLSRIADREVAQNHVWTARRVAKIRFDAMYRQHRHQCCHAPSSKAAASDSKPGPA